MTNAEKFVEVFGTDLKRQYATKSWWDQEFVPPMNENYALNLNDTIKVKLTNHGKDIYYHQFDDLIETGVKITPEMPKVDADGYTKFQLWDFIQLYGQHIGMIKPNVIEPIDIVIEGKNLKELDEK